MSNQETLSSVEWVVSASPHLRERESTARIMWSVAAALVPAGILVCFVIFFIGTASMYREIGKVD